MTTTVLSGYTALVSIPEDMQCTIISAGSSTALVERIREEAVVESVNIKQSQTVVFGEYLTDMVLKVSCFSGSLTYNVAQRTDSTSVQKIGGSMTGVAGNLSVVPAGDILHLAADGQAAVYSALTVNGEYTVDGELRVVAWPA